MSTVPTSTAGRAGSRRHAPSSAKPPRSTPSPTGRSARMSRAGVEGARKGGQRGDALNPGAHRFRRLVDDGAAVDHVDDAPRQEWVLEPRQQGEQHRGRLAEPRGDVHSIRDRAPHERGVEAPLPRVGGVPDDGVKVRHVGQDVAGCAAHRRRGGRGGASEIAACEHGALLARARYGRAVCGCDDCGADPGRGTAPAPGTIRGRAAECSRGSILERRSPDPPPTAGSDRKRHLRGPGAARMPADRCVSEPGVRRGAPPPRTAMAPRFPLFPAPAHTPDAVVP